MVAIEPEGGDELAELLAKPRPRGEGMLSGQASPFLAPELVPDGEGQGSFNSDESPDPIRESLTKDLQRDRAGRRSHTLQNRRLQPLGHVSV
jgi:hypothetical protein